MFKGNTQLLYARIKLRVILPLQGSSDTGKSNCQGNLLQRLRVVIKISIFGAVRSGQCSLKVLSQYFKAVSQYTMYSIPQYLKNLLRNTS